jgi:KUP system potassium uptake protein
MADPIEPPAAAQPSVGPGATALILGAIGVVFGDIGTSPLYTLQECLHSRHGVAPSPENVLGIVSLIGWSVTKP